MANKLLPHKMSYNERDVRVQERESEKKLSRALEINFRYFKKKTEKNCV